MNIGNTPQEQLAVIRYIHKRATIIGIFVAIFYMLIGLLVSRTASLASTDTGGVLVKIAVPLVAAIVAFWYVRACTWTYYQFASQYNMKWLIAYALIAADKDTTIEHDYGPGIGKTYTRGPGYLFTLIASLVIGIFIGTFLSIKYIILELKLEKQLKAEGKTTKTAGINIISKAVSVVGCVGLIILVAGVISSPIRKVTKVETPSAIQMSWSAVMSSIEAEMTEADTPATNTIPIEGQFYLFDSEPFAVKNVYLYSRNNDRANAISIDGWGYPDLFGPMTSMGVGYEKGLEISVDSDNVTQVYYNLEMEYSELSGKIAFADMFIERVDMKYVIAFFADNKLLDRYEIIKGQPPTDVNLRISGCEFLRIDFTRPSDDNSDNPNINLMNFLLS